MLNRNWFKPEMSQPSPNDGLDPDDLPDLSLVLLGHELDVVVFQKHLCLTEGVTIHFQPKNINTRHILSWTSWRYFRIRWALILWDNLFLC